MKKRKSESAYIIVLGTTYSGSGAVYDYLAGRGDICDPLAGEEYQLPQVPHGLMALEAAAGQAFHPGAADYAIVQFQNVVERLARTSNKWRHGKNYAAKIPDFRQTVTQFVNQISTAHFSMRLDWHRLFRSTPQHIYHQGYERLGLQLNPPITRVLKSPEEVLSAAQDLHDRLFAAGTKPAQILLNQAGSGWNPVESTKYFAERKIVLVTRDPLDQFAEIKLYKRASDVEGFISWYRELQRRLAKFDSPRLLTIRFEDFVNSHENTVNQICEHLQLSKQRTVSYRVDLSRKNIGLYNDVLTADESMKIRKASLLQG